jgi:RHS repeat-associated protein
LRIEQLEDRTVPSTVTWVGGSGDWGTAANWQDNTGVHRLPGSGDDVTINVAGVTVTHSSGSDTIHSLTANDAISLTGGTLSVTTTLQDQSPNAIDLHGGTLANATVAAGTSLSAAANSTLTGVTLGGKLSINGGVTVTVNQGLTFNKGTVQLNGFNVDSAGGVFTEPAILTLAGSGTQTLGGSGQVTFAGTLLIGTAQPDQVNVLDSSAGPMVVAAGISVVDTTAGGTLGNPNQSLTLDDSVTASGGHQITVTGSSVSNAGSGGASASSQANGGTLEVTNLQANAGGISASASGTLTLDGTWQNDSAISVSSATLNLNGSWQNKGTITTTQSNVNLGGTFTLAALGTFSPSSSTVNIVGTFNNASTTLTLSDATDSWNLAGGIISGGTVSTTSQTQLTATANSTLTGVTLGGKLSINSGITVTVNQGLTLNNGTVQLNGATLFEFGWFTITASLVLAGSGTQTLGGTGDVIFAGTLLSNAPAGQPDQVDVLDSSAGPLVVAAGVSVVDTTAGGALGNPSQPLTLKGSVMASGGHQIGITGSWTNSGTIAAASEGTVLLGGSFKLSGLGTFSDQGGFIGIAGTFTNDGTLSLTATTGSIFLSGGTIIGGTISTTGGAELAGGVGGGTLNGVTLQGTLDESLFFPATVNVTNGTNLDNATILLAGSAQGSNVLHFSGPQTLGGTCSIQFTQSLDNMPIVDTDSSLTIGRNVTIHGITGTVGDTGGTITNNGTIAADGGGAIAVQNFTNYAGGTLTGGTWRASNNSTLRLIGANITTNAATVVLDGPGAAITSDTGTTSALAGLTTNAAGGQLTLRNGASLALPSLTNGGALTIGASSALTVNSFTQNAGSAVVQGTLGAGASSKVNLQGGTFSGSGTITGSVTNAAELDFGSAAAALQISGTYTQTAAGALNVKVGGSTAGTGYDQLNVSGMAVFAGTLNVSLINGFGPSGGQVFNVITFASSSGSFGTLNLPQSSGSPALGTQTTATSFSLVGAATTPNLAVTTVTFTPAAGTVGQNMTVNYTVQNKGTAAATGSWVDSVYLSADGTLRPDSLLIGQVPHSGPVAGLASYNGTLTAPLPGAMDGTYRILVVADSALQVPDFNRSNSILAGTTPLFVSVPALTIGTPVTRTIANGQDLYYRVNVPPGSDVKLTADFTAALEAEFLVRFDTVPTRSTYDQSASLSDQHPQIVLPTGQGGPYYILLHGREGAGSGQTFTLQAAATASFGVTGVTPNSASNSGQATITITGVGFTPQTVASLQLPDSTLRSPLQLTWQSATTLLATFDLKGLTPGSFSIRVDDNGQTATLANALNIQSATGAGVTPGTFNAQIVTAAYLRPHQPGILDVEVSNPGDTDVPAGVFRIRAVNAVMGLGNAIGTSFVISLATPDGSNFILPPHFDQHIRIGFQPTVFNAHDKVNFFLSVMQKSHTIDWNTLRDNLAPNYIDPNAWNAIFANFTSVVGNTTDQYQSVLAQDATYLTTLGENALSVNSLLGLELEKADDQLPVPSLATTASVDDTLSTLGPPLDMTRSFAFSISGRYHIGLFGRGWSTAWDIDATTDSQGNVIIETPTRRRTFALQPNGTFLGAPGDFATLTVDANGYHLVEKSGARTDFRPDGLLASISDANGNHITAGYTGTQLTSLTASNGSALTITHNAQGRISQITDSVGRVTSYAYDALGEHLMSVSGPRGTLSYTYVTGQGAAEEHSLASITFPDGTHRYFAYDAQGRLISTHLDNNAAAISFSYVSAGGVRATDATGGAETVFYNESLQPGQIQDPLGHIQLFSYDSSHNLIREGFLGGPTYSFAYDQQGNLVQTVNPLGQTTHLAYVTQPTRLSSFTDENGHTTGFTNDSKGNVVAIVAPDGTTTRFAYGASGEVTQRQAPGQGPIRYTYDSLGHLARKDFPDGTHADFTYDAHGNLTSAVDANGSTTLQYDSTDRLVAITYPNGRSLHYTYDSGGRRIRSVDQDGFTVNYSYDSAGRLSELTDGAGAIIVSYSYDAAGRISRKDLGNGTATTYAYNAAGQLVQLVNLAPGGTINSQFSYTYDSLGRRSSLTSSAGTTNYAYDQIGQLTSVTLPGGRQITYRYDAAGNRVAATDNGAGTAYTTNSLDQYTAVGSETDVYDARGNLITATDPSGSTTYQYDLENRLTGVTTPTGTSSYIYNALGQRIAAVNNGARTNYLIDPLGLGNVVGEYDATGSLLARYTYGLGLTSQVTPTSTSYYDFDGAASTIGLTSQTGVYQNQYDYLPYGETQSATEKIRNPFQFSGQIGVMNDGNGLSFDRARSYLPAEGRFISRDPIGLAGGANPYAYAENDPTNFFDGSGQGATDFSVTFGAGIVGTVGIYHDETTGQWSPYFGGGLGTPGVGASGTYAESGATGGLNFGISGSFPGGAGLVSVDEAGNWSYEYGVGVKTPGGAATFTYVFNAPKPPVITTSPNPAFDDRDFRIADFIARDQAAITDETDIANAQVEILAPMDPNGIAGPAGFGPQGFVPQAQLFPYRIDFANEASASAPAQQVVITQKLNSNLDLSTFELGEFSFGGQIFSVPAGRQFYQTRIDDRAARGVFVDVTASLDVSTAAVTWTFTSIDPTTLDQPVGNILEGFLPPDTKPPVGEGWVSYTIKAKSGLTTGTQVNAQASVVFDTNAPMSTPVALNTIDSGAPSSSVSALPAAEAKPTFTVTWLGTDDSGGSGIAFFNVFVSDDHGPFKRLLTGTTRTSLAFAGKPDHTYGFYTVATDNVGNVEPTPTAAEAMTFVQVQTRAVLTSATNPAVFGQAVTFTATVTPLTGGAGTPAGTVTFRNGKTIVLGTATLDASGRATFSTAALGAGVQAINATYGGDAVFVPSPQSLAIAQTVNRAATRVVLNSSLASPIYGQPLTVTAAVSVVAPGAGMPTGFVLFMDGAKKIGTRPLDSHGHATLGTAILSAGDHTITANYLGDSDLAPSGTSSPLQQSVGKASATTTISAPSVTSSVFGQRVNFTATVTPLSPSTGVATGSVNFLDGGVSIGSAVLNGTTRQAIFAISTLGVGTHSITATYAGDANFLATAKTASAGLSVAKDSDTIAIISSAQPAVVGQTVTFTALVRANPPGGGISTGTVTFKDGSTVLDAAALTGGKATFSTAALAVGNHSITVAYAGDADFIASTSAAFGETIRSHAGMMLVTPSANASSARDAVSFQGGTSAAVVQTATALAMAFPAATRGTSPLAASRLDSYFASTPPPRQTRTLAGALSRERRDEDWLRE